MLKQEATIFGCWCRMKKDPQAWPWKGGMGVGELGLGRRSGFLISFLGGFEFECLEDGGIR